MLRFSFLSIAGIGLASAGLAWGADWPEFRGPTGQGLLREGSLPVTWTTSKNVAWKQTLPGSGWSSPVVADGRIYLSAAVPVPDSSAEDQLLRALCLDAANGKVLWDREVFRQDGAQAPRIHGKNSHASPTPIVASGRLYVHFGYQGTACLDLTGKVLWRNTGLTFRPIHGNGGSPILVGDALVFSGDGIKDRFIAALDRNTGALLWKTDRQGEADRKFSFGTPLLITVADRQQIISPASNRVTAYDPATGREIWFVRYDGYSVIPRPVFGHGLVFVCTGFNTPSLLAIRPDGQGDVTATHVAWSMTKGVPHTPSPLLVEDDLYLISDRGVASCLDARTGQVHWQERVSGDYSASPLYAGGKIYLQSEQGVGVVLEASRRYTLVGRNDLGERSLASYAAADGALFIRTEKRLYKIQGR
jgi:outer membrane protein assembly factor BamB